MIEKIDVHAHYLPPSYRTQADAATGGAPDGIPAFPTWDAAKAIAAMDELNIGTAVLSVSSPGVHFGDDEAARKLARVVNEAGAVTVADHPGRFGLFASLPLPDIDGALSEIDYAFATLNADGVILLTNSQGVYLGDSRLEPVFAELNRRNTIMFIHPTSPFCPVCHGSELGFPRPIMEFLFDTTRAVTNLILSGMLDKFPNIQVIVPHAGATLPVMADRIADLVPAFMTEQAVSKEHFFAALRRLHYDLAGFPVPRLLNALLDIADTDRILYGSDWPFTPTRPAAQRAEQIDETALLDDVTREKIYRTNALGLFPRLSP